MLALPSAAELGLLLAILIGLSIPVRMLDGRARKAALLGLSLTGLACVGFALKDGIFAAFLLGGAGLIWLVHTLFVRALTARPVGARGGLFAFAIGVDVAALAALHGVEALGTQSDWAWHPTSGLAMLYTLGAPILFFNALSLLWDVKRGRTTPDALETGLHLFYLPKMMAGPMMSVRALQSTLARPRSGLDGVNDIGYGLLHIGFGLFSAQVVCSFILKLITPVLETLVQKDFVVRGDALASMAGLGLAAFFALSGVSQIGRGVSLIWGVGLPRAVRNPLGATNIVELWQRWLVGPAALFQRMIVRPLGGSVLAVVVAAFVGALALGFSTPHVMLGGFWVVAFLIYALWDRFIAKHTAKLSPALVAPVSPVAHLGAVSVIALLFLPRSGIAFVCAALIIGGWHGLMCKTKLTDWKAIGFVIVRWVLCLVRWIFMLGTLALSATFLLAPNAEILGQFWRAIAQTNEGLSLPAALTPLFSLYNKTWIGGILQLKPTYAEISLLFNQGTGLLAFVILYALTLWIQRRPALCARSAVMWHSITFGVALYLLAAWHFIGPDPLWPGLWR